MEVTTACSRLENFLESLNYSRSVRGREGAVEALISVEVSKNYMSARSEIRGEEEEGGGNGKGLPVRSSENSEWSGMGGAKVKLLCNIIIIPSYSMPPVFFHQLPIL